jgi:mono/diheme cytochrome c family protein
MRIQLEIFLGTLFTVLTLALFMYAGFNEESRMAEWTVEQQAKSIEQGASLFSQACAGCHGPQGQGVPNLAPALNSKAFFATRLEEVGWAGSMEDYIRSTISAGRVVSTRPDLYVGGGRPAMPSWSEEYGGPFRRDEIDNLVAYVLNWEEEALRQPDVTEEPIDGVGVDITLELPEGDAARGEQLAIAQGCTGCHVAQPVGPGWMPTDTEPGVGARAEQRFQQADYTGNAVDASQYLFESTVLPNAYVVEGFLENLMPQDYGEKITAQQLADLIAYMLSLR